MQVPPKRIRESGGSARICLAYRNPNFPPKRNLRLRRCRGNGGSVSHALAEPPKKCMCDRGLISCRSSLSMPAGPLPAQSPGRDPALHIKITWFEYKSCLNSRLVLASASTEIIETYYYATCFKNEIEVETSAMILLGMGLLPHWSSRYP